MPSLHVLALVLLAGCTGDPPDPDAAAPPATELASAPERGRFAGDDRPAFEAQPPPDAQRAGGMPWTLLDAGEGASTGDGTTLRVELLVWQADGTLALDTYDRPGPLDFPFDMAPSPLQPALAQLAPGARARVWIPEDTSLDWPPGFPDRARLIDIEVLELLESPPSRITTRRMGPEPYPFAVPDGAGPPPEAEQTGDGVSYRILASGEGSPTPAVETFELHLTAWAVHGLAVGDPVLDREPTRVRLDQAPEVLQPLLRQIAPGATWRVWLTAEQAAEAVPGTEGRPAVLDLTRPSSGEG